MNYAIKTANGLSVFKVVLNGALPDGPLPAGKTCADCDMWEVDTTIPDGFLQDFSIGSPKGWELSDGVVYPILASIPPEPPAPTRWRVSKDTIIGRIPAASLAAVRSALASQSADEQFIFLNSAWFWSDNITLRGLCTDLGLDADALLARDPFLF